MINKTGFEAYLAELISESYVVEKSMNYSLLAKSKRLRPLLLLNLLADFNIEEDVGYPFGASLEMIHTYSLIHDDLPAFDNDDYRRGQLTNHKAFDEQTAILAGDGLLTYSFETLANCFYDDSLKITLIGLLANYVGKDGMIKGQSFDKEYEGKKVELDDLLKMDNLKTGKLITVAFLAGCYIADMQQYLPLFEEIGQKLGIAFQIQDDILDVTSDVSQLGKSTSDKDNNKTTYVSLLSIDKAQQYVNSLLAQIKHLLSTQAVSFDNTIELIDCLANRSW
ncbi:MAG: polyprenyl synthetase family protein [Erysipelotrichaceae bacterium]